MRDKEKIASQLIHIKSNQKVQYTLWKNDDYSHIYIFSIIFDEIDFNNNLVLYPKTDCKDFIKYGKLVRAEINEKNYINQIISRTEDMMGKNSTEGFIDNDLIYFEDVDKENSYLINTLFTHEITDDKIEILSSTYGYENKMIWSSYKIQVHLKSLL